MYRPCSARPRRPTHRPCIPIPYRGTSLIRPPPPAGPCRSPMIRVLWWSWGGWRFLMSNVPLYALGPHPQTMNSIAPATPSSWRFLLREKEKGSAREGERERERKRWRERGCQCRSLSSLSTQGQNLASTVSCVSSSLDSGSSVPATTGCRLQLVQTWTPQRTARCFRVVR